MKRILILLLALTLSITTIGCGSKENEKDSRQEAINPIGDEIMNIEVILNSTETTTEDKWNELEEGKELLLLNITIKNNNDIDYEFNPNYIHLIVDGEKVFITDKAPEEKDVLNSKVIEPGGRVEGTIAFEIEEGKEYKVIYDDFEIQIDL